MKKFIKFLEANNAWENFERAFENYGKNAKDYKKECEGNINIELDCAFVWAETEEGEEYWEALNEKWIEANKPLKDQLLSDD